jgi:hypothetical protein
LSYPALLRGKEVKHDFDWEGPAPPQVVVGTRAFPSILFQLNFLNFELFQVVSRGETAEIEL